MADKAITKAYLLTQLKNLDSKVLSDKYLNQDKFVADNTKGNNILQITANGLYVPGGERVIVPVMKDSATNLNYELKMENGRVVIEETTKQVSDDIVLTDTVTNVKYALKLTNTELYVEEVTD